MTHTSIPTFTKETMNIYNFANLINALYNEIRNAECSMKIKYYELGMYLQYTKTYCKEEGKSFMDFVEKGLNLKALSQINRYISFYNLSRKYPVLIYCQLTIYEINSNRKNIEDFLSNSLINHA